MQNPQSVIGVVFSPDKSAVLLVERRDVPVWVLPGGGCEPNECAQTAIQREILEETGFHVKVDRLVGVYTPINRLARLTHLYECSILCGSPASTSETRRTHFFPLTALPHKLPPPFPLWIQDALQNSAPLHKTLTSLTYVTFFKHLLLHPVLTARFVLARLGLPINSP